MGSSLARTGVRIAASGVAMAALVTATAAPAQTSTASAPPATRGDAAVLSGDRASMPIRLSLEGSVFPHASLFPNCESREDGAGNSVGGIPLRRYASMRLTPRLVLSGFTQLGCPIDGGLGLALTYAVPLRESMWLVLGAGMYAAPGQTPLFGGTASSLYRALRSEPSAVGMAGKADLVWQSKGGHPLSLGVESVGMARQGVTFGAGF
jgi:hypothetical protein